ncbi:MAG: carboxylate-amine ligase [Marinovum sp.]|nr:carboxylate-amine ligase [Marinovum sp.]
MATRDPSRPDFTLGIEEEYLLVDRETHALASVPPAMLAACTDRLGSRVSPEYLACQIEVGTGVCATIEDARTDLRELRGVIREEAHRVGLAPIAASCHPTADWKDQANTNKPRYNQLRSDLGGVVERMLICGMHVHVGLGDNAAGDALRIDLMSQLSYFLPHLLALSTSSPYWQGQDTKLASYRLTVFDNLPRTGLPPQLGSWAEYERSVAALVDIGVIEDSTKIWWDLRPSDKFPTLETRIMDVQPRMEDSLTLAATVQCLTRMLWRLKQGNQRWRLYDNFLVAENRWRAQRYGATEGLIDFGQGEILPLAALTQEIVELTAEDADVLECTAEIARLPHIACDGTSSERQRAVCVKDGIDAVVPHLIAEFEDALDLDG